MLFVPGIFTSAAGLRLAWKIECESLTNEDWETVASMVGSYLSFGVVEGVPRGGLLFAEALGQYAWGQGLLIVDDVLTTGLSMENHRKGRPANGLVLFARGPHLPWVSAVWTLGPWIR